MTELLTSEQMRRLEREAIDSQAVTGLALMECAGQGVCDALFKHWPQMIGQKLQAVVFCGPGNNGGDGYVIARLLVARGWRVDLYQYGETSKLPPDARVNHDRWVAAHPVLAWNIAAFRAGARPDLIVDAVFGIGLTRPLPKDVLDMLDCACTQHWPDANEIKKVAVDCPSGLNLDTGLVPVSDGVHREMPAPVTGFGNIADLTVTFHAPKVGHYLQMGPTMCSQLAVADIGLPGAAAERCTLTAYPDTVRARLVEPVFDGASHSSWPRGLIAKARHGGHKYDHGHVVVFAGGVGKGGAARMAARAALRSGAGLVTVVCPPAALQENASALDAVMLRALPRDGALSDVVDARVSGFVMGPGMGVSERTRELVYAALQRKGQGGPSRDPVVVLDADALTSFENQPDGLYAATHGRTILTPHEGEFARLFPDLSAAQRGTLSKLDAVRHAAARAGCLVLLKGVDTVIAAPDGAASLHAACYGREAPWLATAGAGDVLAGLIAGLGAPAAAGPLFNMAEVAVWLHVEAARAFGPGLIAEDLPDLVPGVLRAQLG